MNKFFDELGEIFEDLTDEVNDGISKIGNEIKDFLSEFDLWGGV